MGYFKSVHGVSVPYFFPDDAVASALAYEPQKGDVFIVAYSKCGTTWVQYITYCILHNGEPPSSITELFTGSPYLELFGADDVNIMPRPGTIKTHLPFEKLRYSSRAKYICVARNPYDVCVSQYHQAVNLMASEEDLVDFNEFVKRFVSRGCYGCYLEDSLIPWYARRSESNVLFLTYEQLHADTKQQVKKLADFLGYEYGQRVSTDPDFLQRIVDLSAKERMRPVVKDYLKEMIEYTATQRTSRNLPLTPGLHKALQFARKQALKHEFIREGAVGGYVKFLSESNREVLKQWITTKTSGTDVTGLWSNVV